MTETANGWLVDVVGQGVRYQLRCKQIIDCTGGATVAGMLGMERMREETRQPGTHSVVYLRVLIWLWSIKIKRKFKRCIKLRIAEGRLKER